MSRTQGRADQRLLDDVRAATATLIASGLAPRHAHALIERAILIRYLEDRGVLTDRYFDDLVGEDQAGRAVLDAEDEAQLGGRSLFIRALTDRSLTYALFDALAEDFNGDLFVLEAAERSAVTQLHLRLLRDLLQGTASSPQEPLFLWAYDFSVVPTSLVSTMYELFYRQEVEDKPDGTYYTPADLVEFVLSDLLLPEVLDRDPVVCDPACGSGAFLVEAYRRIVRHRSASIGGTLSTAELRELLISRVAGCDVDESAVRLAAFSLYVAFLNYQSPQDIRTAGPLPPLIARSEADAARPLHVADAFSRLSDEVTSQDGGASLPWAANSFDVVVGNPPWTEPRAGGKTAAEQWVDRAGRTYGDRSPSQLFLWRTLDLLADDGVASLLVSAKVFFNVRSRRFRAQWLEVTRLQRVINFSEVRHDFFERAVAPFALVRFAHASLGAPDPVVYETARQVSRGRRGEPALARLDRRIVDQQHLMARDERWKTYSAGDHRDDALVQRLELENSLATLLPPAVRPQYGFQPAQPSERCARRPGDSWRNLLSVNKFESWGPLRPEWTEPVPEFVKREPPSQLYFGPRLLVRRTVATRFGPHARLISDPLAFRHTTYCIPMSDLPSWQAEVILATLLSSAGRYWLYMVAGSWGSWSDEIYADHLLRLPVRISAEHPANERLGAAVRALPHVTTAAPQLQAGDPRLSELSRVLASINDGVAELFELSRAERDLVEDFWAGRHKDAAKPIPLAGTGLLRDADGDVLANYGDVFRTAWQPLLGDAATLDVSFWRDARADVVAAVFETRDPQPSSLPGGEPGAAAWSDVLDRYRVALRDDRANKLLTYGVLRAVSDSAIVVVKHNERRLWSSTSARRDAEATTAQALAMQTA